MKRYLLLIIVSVVLVLFAVLAGLVLAPTSYSQEKSNSSGLFHQEETDDRAAEISISNSNGLNLKTFSDQAITLQVPDIYLQKQLDLVLEAAPFGSEIRGYQSPAKQICLSFSPYSETVSRVESPAEPGLINLKEVWDELHSPAYDSYVISLWHPTVTLSNYTLVPNPEDLPEKQSDPHMACANAYEKTEMEW